MTTTEQEREPRKGEIYLLIDGEVQLIQDLESDNFNRDYRHCRLNHVKLKAQR